MALQQREPFYMTGERCVRLACAVKLASHSLERQALQKQPDDVVAALGNGSTKAGSDKLYDMMHSIRAHARSSKPKDLPPPAKSPLEYLKGAKSVRRT